jgi:p21-activated kinase 1
MRFSSRDETCDSNTPSGPSTRTQGNGRIRRKSLDETIQSYQGSISNSSTHTISTIKSADTHKDLSGPSGRCFPPPISHHSSTFDHKSFHSLEKKNYSFRNQSPSTLCTTREPDSGSTSPFTPEQVLSSLLFSEDDFGICLPPPIPFPQDIVPTRAEAPGPSPTVFAAPPPPLNGPLVKSYGDSQLFATTQISTADTPAIGPTSFFPSQTVRIGTSVNFKKKKGSLGFRSGLRKSVDFRGSNKRPDVSAPYDPVHVHHVDLNSITGKFTILPGTRQEFFQDNRISKHDQEKDSLATIEFSLCDDWEMMRNDALKVPRPPPPCTVGKEPTANTEVFKLVDSRLTSTGLGIPRFPPLFSDSSKLLSLKPPKTVHSRAQSSSGSQVVSTTHPPVSCRPFPSPPPVRLDLDLSDSQQALPKPPRNDTLVRGSLTGDQLSPEPQTSVGATAMISPVTERQTQPTMVPLQQSEVAASLEKSAGAIPRRREKRTENKENDADLMKRLQGICKNADPTRLYRNLVKIGQG